MDETLTELTEKQVVNVCDGRILGYVIDFKVDICSGRLTAIIVPSECGFFGIKKGVDIVIPWEKICKIGKDTIIVDVGLLPPKEDGCEGQKKKKKLF